MKKINHNTTTLNMQSSISSVILFFLINLGVYAQTITGQFSELPNQNITLQGFENFDIYVIDSTQTDAQGKFTLNFSSQNYGLGLVAPVNGTPFITVLTNEAIQLKGKTTAQPESIQFIEGNQNKAFLRFVTEQPKREQALSAWNYLQKMYVSDPFYTNEKQTIAAIEKEIKRINKNEHTFLDNFAEGSFIKWYIPTRKLLSSVAQVAQYRPEEIPATRQALRNINYADARLFKSGLLKEAIENHIWFIENSSGPLDSVFADLNISTDVILNQLKDDNEKFNLVASRMFEVLEKRSLFTSSEYLSKQLLENEDCGCLNPDLEKRLHKYGKMATGATAPDIRFTEFTYYPKGVTAKKLSEVNANHYLVVFAAGWCGHCVEAMPEIAAMYPDLKAKNIEVVLVSLDENANDFAMFAAPFPFISTTDFKKWESQAAVDYQVYGTPSYFLLDKELTIVRKLNSVEHIKVWVDWNVK